MMSLNSNLEELGLYRAQNTCISATIEEPDLLNPSNRIKLFFRDAGMCPWAQNYTNLHPIVRIKNINLCNP